MRTLFIRAVLTVIAVSGVLAVIMLVRTATLETHPAPDDPAHPFGFDEAGAVERLGSAVRISTVSHLEPADRDPEAWHEFHRFLETSFPRLHAVADRETVSELSLLYTWSGTDPSLDPILLSTHSDVVPVPEGSSGGWTHPPFAGVVADQHVWGRGTLDNKGPLMALLEAVEGLIAAEFAPRRTVLLAIGHDEEIGGEDGAARIAELLEARDIRPVWALDEGMAVVNGMIPGLADPVGMVGTAEKGYTTLLLTARGEGGHSSAPADTTTIGRLSRAITRLEEDPFPARIQGPTRELLETLGPHLDPGTRMLAANLWLLERPVASALTESPSLASALRTTTAPTVVEAGRIENMLPEEARALVNFRIAPWDSPDAVLEQVRELVADLGVEAEHRPEGPAPIPPSRISSSEAEGFHLIRETIHRIFPDVVVVAPALVTAATDARHYDGVATDVYRFAPFRADPTTLDLIHGTDERIAVRGYLDMVRFYAELLRRGAG